MLHLFSTTRQMKTLLFLVAVLLLAAIPAQAAWMLCRSDPVVLLSNGATFDLSADISVLALSVTEVHYTMHGPTGTSLVTAISTPTWLTTQETFEYIADQSAGQYYATVLVHTTQGNASVVANADVVTAEGVLLAFYSASGVEGVPITVTMQ